MKFQLRGDGAAASSEKKLTSVAAPGVVQGSYLPKLALAVLQSNAKDRAAASCVWQTQLHRELDLC